MKTTKIKKIKKSITKVEMKKLIAFTLYDDDIKTFNRERLLKIFTLLYYSGMRVNELTQITYIHIDEIIQTGETIIVTHKTKNQRVLFFSPKAITEIKKYFVHYSNKNEFVICSWGKPSRGFHPISLISLVNKYMQKVLGLGFSSHSFRQGIITEFASNSVNPRVIQSFIGHRNVKTTLNYIKPTADDVKNSLVR